MLTTTEDPYKDECVYGYGAGRYRKCGDKCVGWQIGCSCGNLTLAFLKLDISHYCCSESAPCEYKAGYVHCPEGRVLAMSEQCGGKCYNDWEMSKYLDPVNSNFKCPFLDVRVRNPGCLPTTELCQGLDICGEVHICNENNLRCPKDWSASRFFDVQNFVIKKLKSKLSNNHYYCHYSNYFDDDLEYDYIDRKDEVLKGSRKTTTNTIDHSALEPCVAQTWADAWIGGAAERSLCNCSVSGVTCPGSNLYTTFSDSCIPMVLWCREDNQYSCQVGNNSIGTADEKLCKNYTFWRSMHEDLSFLLLSNTMKVISLSCRGVMQKIYLPWYYNSLGSLSGLLTAFKGTCEDQSEKIHQRDSLCDSKLYLQQYSDLWCGVDRDSKLKTRCQNLLEWFSAQEDSFYTDPHSCQDSCLHPGYRCEACTNPDYFICEQSHVCIHPALVCDGHPQCQFAEDENLELCANQNRWVKRGVVAPYASFNCKSEMYPTMSTVATACNGVVECYDGADEGSCSDTLSTYFLVISIFCVILMYLILKYTQKRTHQEVFKKKLYFKFTLESLGNIEYKNYMDDQDTIDNLNKLLLHMIFSENRNVIRENCISFYNMVAKAKDGNEPEIFCYLHNNFDPNIVKEIFRANFPGLTEKVTDGVEKIFHYEFITKFKDEVTKNDKLDKHLSTLNTIRKVISNSMDFFKDSYIALYLLVIIGGPKVLLEYITNFTSVIILSMVGTIIIPIITSSVYVSLKDPNLVFIFMEKTALKWKRRTVALFCMICGPLLPILLLFNLQTTLTNAKRCAKNKEDNVLYSFKKYKQIKNLLVSMLRIELGKEGL